MDTFFTKLNENISEISKAYALECLKIWIPAFIEATGDDVEIDQDGLIDYLSEKMPAFKFPICNEKGKAKKPRAPTAYAFFQSAKRVELKEEHPGWSEEKIRKAISEEWAEADKEQWKEKAGIEKKDKIRKRGISGYNLFSREMREKVKSDEDLKENTEIMKALGERWKALSDREKQKWNEGAKKENEKNGFSSGSSVSGKSKASKKEESDVESEVESEVEASESEDDKPIVKRGKGRK